MYQVLARKYRPKNFHELLGQTHVSKALINAIDQQRLHHAYLFTGTRGVGKTTIARILAKCLNCETGITSKPCGICQTCQSIDAGRFIDLIEVDAASRTKVEDTREILDNVPYAPTQGRYKVYLIDEVHMLSTHSFNALLKTLEEPPEHVKFLLATTDPQKLPITIISRCLQFVLRPLSQKQLTEYLADILKKETINYQTDALWLLANSAKGSVRDALSLTDQAIAFGNGTITDETVKQMLGLIDQADIIGLLKAIYQQNHLQVAESIQLLRQQVVDAKAIFDNLAEILHQIALIQLLPNFDLQLDSKQTQARQDIARQLPTELLQLYYEIVTQSRENIGLANTPQQALEMCILRLLAFRPLLDNEVTSTEHLVQPLNESHQTNDIIEPPSIITPQVQPTAETVEAECLLFQDTKSTIQEAILNKEKIFVYNFSEQIFSPIIYPENIQNIYQLSLVCQLSIQIPDRQESEENQETNNIQLNQPVSSYSLEEYFAENEAHSSTLNKVYCEEEFKNKTLESTTAETILQLLQPAAQNLDGEWTIEKWDYWVYQARINSWLEQDELVLAKKGIMQGSISDKSYFLIDEKFFGIKDIFLNFFNKLYRFFPTIQIHMRDDLSEEEKLLFTQNPEQRQLNREKTAKEHAMSIMQNELVMQALLKQSASLVSVKLTNL